jgi:hypothetical protein
MCSLPSLRRNDPGLTTVYDMNSSASPITTFNATDVSNLYLFQQMFAQSQIDLSNKVPTISPYRTPTPSKPPIGSCITSPGFILTEPSYNPGGAGPSDNSDGGGGVVAM